MIEQLLYHYVTRIHGNPVIHGRVLNVGLGEGTSARFFLHLRTVSQVVTVEKDRNIVLSYHEKNDDILERNHLILIEDAEFADPVGPYDVIFFDILYDISVEKAKACLFNIRQYMHPDAHMIIEFREPYTEDKEIHKWLTQNFMEIRIRPPLASHGIGRGGQMSLYKLH